MDEPSEILICCCIREKLEWERSAFATIREATRHDQDHSGTVFIGIHLSSFKTNSFMKKFAVWYIPLLIVLLSVSCSKEKPAAAKEDPCNRITEVLDYHPYDSPTYQSTAVITYDENGRIKTIKGPGQNRTEFIYYKDSIVMKATDIFGGVLDDVYFLDGAGRVARTRNSNYDFRYDAEGYLVSFQQPYGYNGQINGYTPYRMKYENGNLVEVYTTDPNIVTKSFTLDYYPEPNQELMGYNSPLYIGRVIGDRNTFYLVRGGFFGKSSKNLLKNAGFANTPRYSDIKYKYDAKGRIIRIEDGYTFNYQCP